MTLREQKLLEFKEKQQKVAKETIQKLKENNGELNYFDEKQLNFYIQILTNFLNTNRIEKPYEVKRNREIKLSQVYDRNALKG